MVRAMARSRKRSIGCVIEGKFENERAGKDVGNALEIMSSAVTSAKYQITCTDAVSQSLDDVIGVFVESTRRRTRSLEEDDQRRGPSISEVSVAE